MDEMTSPKPFLSGHVYDILKWIAQIFLPALGTLYFSLSAIWGLPAGEQVVGTVTAIVLFLGLILNVNSNRYYSSDERFSGTVSVDQISEKAKFSIDEEDLHDKDEITLKVEKVRKRK